MIKILLIFLKNISTIRFTTFFGSPDVMQKNPKYKNVLLIFMTFLKKIKQLRDIGIKHNNIILDPGIGFGKNLKHNMTILKEYIDLPFFGLPILLGISRKKFIKDLSNNNDSTTRVGGNTSSSIFAMMNGIQILRVHDVNEINQSLKVFKELIDKMKYFGTDGIRGKC